MTINESFLYYLWQNKNFDLSNLVSVTGEEIEILHFGNRNLSSGPDFHNAKIKIGNTLWAGNVEMHVQTSDWNRHKHEEDDAYNNVILHVVYHHDMTINHVPVLELKNRVNPILLKKYDQLMSATQWVSCEHSLPLIDKEKFSLWSHQFAFSRLENKYEELKKNKSYAMSDWNQLMYERITRYFGAVHNGDNFESIAQRLPYKTILKNRHQPLVIESLLFGISGLLEEDLKDEYFQQLKKEYLFQKSKYKLTPLNKVVWKRFGMYLWGTPAYRLAQLSGFIQHIANIFDEIKSVQSVFELRKLFAHSPNEYWYSHYNFGKSSNKPLKRYTPSDELIDRIIINAVIPVLFTYAKDKGDDELVERCIDLMSKINAEDNSIIKKWKSYGFKPKSALDSQALIELKNNFCDYKLCLLCPIGREIIKQQE